jgi:gluconate 2-dehydrogenase gamma chain
MKKINISANRRQFLRGAIAAGPAVAVAMTATLSPAMLVQAQNPTSYKPAFFNQDEFALLRALVDTMIPADDTGPGAIEAGVAEFIDAQMNTPYGKGQLWYMQGPFDPHAPAEFGYQLPYPPSELYRKGLAEFSAAVRKQYGKAFEALPEQQRMEALGNLEKGALEMADIPPAVLFTQLLQNVHEGYFCDPTDGGNRGMLSWKMIGFPGARADYFDWVEQYGKPYPLPPISRG